MSSNLAEKKNLPVCDCPTVRGAGIITITIETACRRTCECPSKESSILSSPKPLEDRTTSPKASHKSHSSSSVPSPQKTPSLQSFEDKLHEAKHHDDKHHDDRHHDDRHHDDKHHDDRHHDDKHHDDRHHDDRHHDPHHDEPHHHEPHPHDSHHHDIKHGPSDEKSGGDGNQTTKEEPQMKIYPYQPKETVRLFKLPILTERHHGKGCAMEISVLERHEDSCTYKKADNNGRTPDDRVGSYECIGRMVFRTCNATELESDSSGSQGITGNFTGVSPTELAKITGGKPASTNSTPHPIRKDSITPPPSPTKPASVTMQKQHSPISVSSQRTERSSERSEYGTPMASSSVKSDLKEDSPQPSTNGEKTREEQIMFATKVLRETAAIDKLLKESGKRHYPGDDCKLHLPREPALIPTGQFEKVYSSKKTFPIYADMSNQTEVSSDEFFDRESLETISSLTDMSKSATKRKSSFFKTLFKRNTAKSSNTEYRHKRA